MNFQEYPELFEFCYDNKRDDFININEIPEEHCDNIYHICFTFTIPANNWIKYHTSKGTSTRRRFSKCPYSIQKRVLSDSMPEHYCYYFEKHIDDRYHLHGYAYTTVNEMNAYRKYQFQKIDCDKSDIQDKLFLCEITRSKPSWVRYCKKEQDLTKEMILELEKPIIKIEERDYSKYLHGQDLTVFL